MLDELSNNSLTPERLDRDLRRYQSEIGEDFDIKDFVHIREIQALSLIAEAINDAPEFLTDQIGKLRNGMDVGTIPTSLDVVSDAISELAEAVREHD